MNLSGLAVGTTTPKRIRPGHFSRPSMLAVYRVLLERRLRLPEIIRATGYARRTVSGVLRDLDEAGLLSSVPDLTDTRHTWYWIPQDGTSRLRTRPRRSRKEGRDTTPLPLGSATNRNGWISHVHPDTQPKM